jgi:SAM-dependent methyltransferase
MSLFFPLNWVSSTRPENADALEALSKKMAAYYSGNMNYFDEFISHEWLWNNNDYLPFVEIKNAVDAAASVLEVGCGNAAILQGHENWYTKYNGIDFSEELMIKNASRFPGAQFNCFEDVKHYPYADGSFELVFSTFVVEHTVYPASFLSECWRVLKPNGHLIVMGPNFFDNGFMPSQRVSTHGWSTRKSLKHGKLFEAFRTWWYHRVLIPSKCRQLSKRGISFVVNLDPSGLDTNIPMAPDLDATYVASFKEMQAFLEKNGGKASLLPHDLSVFLQSQRLGLIKVQKLP